MDEYLEMHQAVPVTIAKLRWLLGKATAELGEKRLADLSPRDVYAWRFSIPEGHRFEATQALRQVLNRGVAWGFLDYNPAKRGVPNPARRAKEKRPFETWQQIEAVAAQLGPVYTPMVIFAAATGLRPSELFGLEQRDIDRQAGVVYVRRAYANGRLKHTKTRLSTRAVPLQAKALEALEQLPASDNPILFPNARGGRIDFRIFGRKHWRQAQIKAGVEPVRGLYDLRHTYATFALRAGVPVFAVSRFMGTSLAMIDRHYGNLANDSREHAVALLDALAFERSVDVAPNAPEASQEDGCGLSIAPPAAPRGHQVDAAHRFCRLHRRRKELTSRDEAKPPRGLEPRTPSLPCAAKRLPWVATGCGSACLSGFRGCSICHRLPPVAPAGLRKCSIPSPGSPMAKGVRASPQVRVEC
ncbi:MAG: tyrosine-type recombinase/integrase [Gaiellaceae bacterium]